MLPAELGRSRGGVWAELEMTTLERQILSTSPSSCAGARAVFRQVTDGGSGDGLPGATRAVVQGHGGKAGKEGGAVSEPAWELGVSVGMRLMGKRMRLGRGR